MTAAPTPTPDERKRAAEHASHIMVKFAASIQDSRLHARLFREIETELALVLASARLAATPAWRPGNEVAQNGDMIVAAFDYFSAAIGLSASRDLVIVYWDNEMAAWVYSNGDMYDGPNDELPTWYRKFDSPPTLPSPPEQER